MTHCAINCVLAFASFRDLLPHPSPPLMVSTYPFPLCFYAVWRCRMVVAAHRVARDSLARDSDALSPSIHPGTNPKPHLLLMSLINIITAHERTLGKETQQSQQGLFYGTNFVHDTFCIISSIILSLYNLQIKSTTYLAPVSRVPRFPATVTESTTLWTKSKTGTTKSCSIACTCSSSIMVSERA